MQIQQLFRLLALLTAAGSAGAHVTLEQPQAAAGSTYKAALRVGHACEGAQTTTAITVRLPDGFRGAKPMPKPGWTTTVKRVTLAQPYVSHGTTVTSDVVEVKWQAASAESALSGDFYDEFVVRGQLPEAPGRLWFKVLQTCDRGAIDWAEIPASGQSSHGLQAPAASLDVVAESGHAAHAH